MKRQKGKHLTTYDIVDVFYLVKEGKPDSYIKKKMGITNPNSVMNTIQKARESNGFGVSKRYAEAVRIIENQEGNILLEEEMVATELQNRHGKKTDPFEYLKQADDIYHNSIEQFVTMLIQDKLKEKDMAYKELKSDYDVLKNKARSSNWISNLQKQFI